MDLSRKKWAKGNTWGRTQSVRFRGAGNRGLEADTETASKCQEAPHEEVATEVFVHPIHYDDAVMH